MNTVCLFHHQLCVHNPAIMEVHVLTPTLAPVQVSGLDQPVLHVSTYLCPHACCIYEHNIP